MRRKRIHVPSWWLSDASILAMHDSGKALLHFAAAYQSAETAASRALIAKTAAGALRWTKEQFVQRSRRFRTVPERAERSDAGKRSIRRHDLDLLRNAVLALREAHSRVDFAAGQLRGLAQIAGYEPSKAVTDWMLEFHFAAAADLRVMTDDLADAVMAGKDILEC